MPASVDDLIGVGMPTEQAIRIGHVEYPGDPTTNLVPQCVGQFCHDTANDDWYVSHALAAANWKIMAT